MRKTKPVFDGAVKAAPMVYLCAISAITMYIMCRSHVLITTILMSALCCGAYMLFYAVRNRKVASLAVFVLLLGVTAGVYALTTSQRGYNSVPDFIYGASEEFDPLLAACSIMMFSFIAAYPTFYFSVKLPRPAFMIMPALAPLMLGARTVGTIPGGYIAFLTASYFVAAMGVSRARYPAESVYIEDKSVRRERLVMIGVLGAAVGAAIFIIPRSDTTQYGRYLDRAFFYNSSLYGTQSMTGFMSGSSLNTGNNHPAKNLLFYAHTEKPRDIITQSFDRYNGKKGWTYLREYSTGYSDWRDTQRLLNYSMLAYELKEGAKNGKLSDYADDLLRIPDIPDSDLMGSTMFIRVMDSSNTAVIRHPANTYNAVINGKNPAIYRNEKDEIFTERPFGANASYSLSYYADPPPDSFTRYISGMERDEFFKLLRTAAEEEVISEEEATAFENVWRNASAYYSITYDNAITPKIQELADSITRGLTNNYDKALAIEQWFGKAGFVYDLNFVPQELTAEYFLFTSKRGICTDFATASALLLRAAGIPARYTEGYTLSQKALEGYGQYAVTSEYAHAFATAFIPGSGWINIDGTKYAALASESKELQLRVFIIAAGVLAVGALCVIFRKRLSEFVFMIRWRMPGKNKIRRLYIRTRKLACGITGADPSSATTGEVREILTRTLMLEKEANEITRAAEVLFYGSGKPDADPKQLYRDYKQIKKFRRMKK